MVLNLAAHKNASSIKEILKLIMALYDICRLKWAVPMWELDRPYSARGSTPRNNQISIFKLRTVALQEKKNRAFFIHLLDVIIYTIFWFSRIEKRIVLFVCISLFFYVNQYDYQFNYIYLWFINSLISWLSQWLYVNFAKNLWKRPFAYRSLEGAW